MLFASRRSIAAGCLLWLSLAGCQAEPVGHHSLPIVEAPDSTVELAFSAGKAAGQTYGIAAWRITTSSDGTGGFRLDGLDAAGDALRVLEIVVTGSAIHVSLDGAPVMADAEGSTVDELLTFALADVEGGRTSAESLACDQNCRAARRMVIERIIGHLLQFNSAGQIAVGILAARCFDCFVWDTNCDRRPLPWFDGTCRDAKINLVASSPVGILAALDDVRRYCRCLLPGGGAESTCQDEPLPASCTDEPCDAVCADASGDVTVERNGYTETCHCGWNPCAGSGDPCCGVACAPGQSCDAGTGSCVPDAPSDPCAGVTCAPGSSCSPWSGLCEPTTAGANCPAECAGAGQCAGSLSVWTTSGLMTCWCDPSACAFDEVCDAWGTCAGPGSTCVLDGVCDPDESCPCDPACCTGGGGDGDVGGYEPCTWCGGSTITSSQCAACGGEIVDDGQTCDQPIAVQGCGFL